ncbi:MAG: sugar ABC transporter permease, partial [Clostridia bacterium]|nr:sugar ABC transporter permease [Clostridia bacterium]
MPSRPRSYTDRLFCGAGWFQPAPLSFSPSTPCAGPESKEVRSLDSPLNRRKWEPYVWLLPSILLISIFVVFPILIVFKLSFSDISKAGVIGGFVGFKNFKEAVQLPAFKTVMINTFIWVISVVGLSTVLGFIIAMVLNQKFRGRKIARAILVFPWATSLVIQASVWNYIIKYEYGNLNNVLLNLGIIQQAINWRASYQIEFIWECGVGIFVTVPFVAFCVLSGLQSIDGSLYEAATVDGAGFWDKLWKITIPMVRPSLTVSTVLNIIYVFNSFPIIYTMTKGAPANKTDTMITYLYMLSFYDRRK